MRRYRTQADLDHHAYLVRVAQVTGRVLFGQLWQPDPALDDLLYVVYAPAVAAQLATPSPLMQALHP